MKLNKELLGKAVYSIFDGNLIDDYEFQTRIGCPRSELGKLLDEWSSVDLSQRDSAVILHNCCAELCYGVNVNDLFLQKYFEGATISDLEVVFLEWKQALEFDPRDEQ